MVRSQTGLLTSAAAEPLPGGAGGAAGVVGGGGGTRAHPASRGEVKEPDAADGGQVREGDRRPRGALPPLPSRNHQPPTATPVRSREPPPRFLLSSSLDCAPRRVLARIAAACLVRARLSRLLLRRTAIEDRIVVTNFSQFASGGI